MTATATVTVGRWNEATCPARFRTTCSVCHEAIGAGMRIAVLPFKDVRHSRCHEALVSESAARPRKRSYR